MLKFKVQDQKFPNSKRKADHDFPDVKNPATHANVKHVATQSKVVSNCKIQFPVFFIFLINYAFVNGHSYEKNQQHSSGVLLSARVGTQESVFNLVTFSVFSHQRVYMMWHRHPSALQVAMTTWTSLQRQGHLLAMHPPSRCDKTARPWSLQLCMSKTNTIIYCLSNIRSY